jgi:hypothetical protein
VATGLSGDKPFGPLVGRLLEISSFPQGMMIAEDWELTHDVAERPQLAYVA